MEAVQSQEQPKDLAMWGAALAADGLETHESVETVPTWFRPLAKRIDAWIDASHEQEPLRVPAFVQELAAAHPQSAAAELMWFLEARGVEVVEGEFSPGMHLAPHDAATLPTTPGR